MKLRHIGIMLLGLALASLAGRARAATFPLADESVEFEPPSDYCLLDRNEEGLPPMFDRMERLQLKGGNQLLAIFILCDELSQIRHGLTSSPSHYGLLVTVLQGGAVKAISNATRFDLIEKLRGTLGSDQIDDIKAKADDALKQEGIVSTHLGTPIFAGADDFALYSSSVIDFGDSIPMSTSGVYAITMVKHFVLAIYLYAPGPEPSVKEGMLAIQHSLLADFVRRNESPAEQERQRRTGESTLGIDWGHALVKGAIGAVIGGLIALVRTLIRRRRAKAS